MIQNVAAIEEECRLLHAVIDTLEVQALELVPLGEKCNGMSTIACCVCILLDCDRLCNCIVNTIPPSRVVPLKLGSAQVLHELLFADLGVIDAQLSPIICETLKRDKPKTVYYAVSMPPILCCSGLRIKGAFMSVKYMSWMLQVPHANFLKFLRPEQHNQSSQS